MHAEMWHERLRDEPRFRDAVAELWPYALGVLQPAQRAALAATRRAGRGRRGRARRARRDELAALRDEMTIVRRSAPAGAQW